MSTTVYITKSEAEKLRAVLVAAFVPVVTPIHVGAFFTSAAANGYDYYIVPDNDPRLATRTVDPFKAVGL